MRMELGLSQLRAPVLPSEDCFLSRCGSSQFLLTLAEAHTFAAPTTFWKPRVKACGHLQLLSESSGQECEIPHGLWRYKR